MPNSILLVAPSESYDISGFLKDAGLSPFEVSVLWDKNDGKLGEEISKISPSLVITIKPGESVSNEILGAIRANNRQNAFVNLHHHDEYSIRDGLGTVNQLVEFLKKQKRSFCCVTNHASIGGWVKQYNACNKAGVKAIFGMEGYTSPYRGDDPELKKAHRSANHIILLAKTEEGFYNIIRIHNDAQLNGFYYTPRSDRAAFEKWGKGIIGTSACYKGEICSLLMEDKFDEAKKVWEFYSSCLDEFYIEIQIIESDMQREANRRLIKFAKSVGAPLVLGIDSHYLDKEYTSTHELLMLMRQKKTILDKEKEKDDIWLFDVGNLYYRTASDIERVFKNGWDDKDGHHVPFEDDVFSKEVLAEAIENTRKIALSTEVIKLDPSIKLPKLYPDGKRVMRQKINDGFIALRLYEKPDADVYKARLAHEFKIINDLGFCDYFLIMEKILSDVKKEFGEFAIGPGRGSSASSLVCYCLGITSVDPIHYKLLFERFIAESRGDFPDIDVDLDPNVRPWVKKHITELFGADKVCSIGTYNTFKTRAVILDVARVLGLDVHEANAVTKRIEPLKAFEDDDGAEFKVDQMDFDDICEHYPELKSYFDANPEVKKHAEVLRNQIKNMGMHAGGVIISDMTLTDRIPVVYDKPASEDRKVVSAWAESGSIQELSSVGLVKVDLLGLNTLPIISGAVRLIEETTGKKIGKSDIPIDDRDSIFLGSKRDLVGIFQFENPVTKPIADEVRLESLNDVAAVTSLIRPGPMDAEIDGVRMPMEYARRKKGGEYEAPEFIRKAFEETYSILIYQENIMALSRILAEFTAQESNVLRRATGKKKADLMASLKDKFINGSEARINGGDITREEVVRLWGNIEKFAGYAFCLAWDTVVETPDGYRLLSEISVGDKVLVPNSNGVCFANVVGVMDQGSRDLYEVTLESGKTIKCTIDHKFLCEDGVMRTLGDIVLNDCLVVCSE